MGDWDVEEAHRLEDENRTRLMSDWSKRLDGIKADCQQENWNSYNARPVTDAAIDAARILCHSLSVSPRNCGGIEVFLAAEGVSIDLDAEGRIETVYCDVKDTNLYVELNLAEGRNSPDD